MEKKYLNQEGLTTYNKAINKKLNTLDKADITSFTTSKPDENNVITINAITKNNQNIQALTLYDSLDGRYPYSALTAKQGQLINSRLNNLEGSTLNTILTYYFDGDKTSNDNKDMFNEIYDKVSKGEQVMLIYGNGVTNFLDSGCELSNSTITFKFKNIGFMETTSYGVRYMQPWSRAFSFDVQQQTISSKDSFESDNRIKNLDTIVAITNTTPWTPTEDYGVVNKKYVDDKYNETISSTSVKKIEVVTEYPAVLDEDTLYLLVSD